MHACGTFFSVAGVLHVIGRDVCVTRRQKCAIMPHLLCVVQGKSFFSAGKCQCVTLRIARCPFPEHYSSVVGHFVSQLMRMSCDYEAEMGVLLR